jgi:hypothetical protein
METTPSLSSDSAPFRSVASGALGSRRCVFGLRKVSQRSSRRSCIPRRARTAFRVASRIGRPCPGLQGAGSVRASSVSVPWAHPESTATTARVATGRIVAIFAGVLRDPRQVVGRASTPTWAGVLSPDLCSVLLIHATRVGRGLTRLAILAPLAPLVDACGRSAEWVGTWDRLARRTRRSPGLCVESFCAWLTLELPRPFDLRVAGAAGAAWPGAPRWRRSGTPLRNLYQSL